MGNTEISNQSLDPGKTKCSVHTPGIAFCAAGTVTVINDSDSALRPGMPLTWECCESQRAIHCAHWQLRKAGKGEGIMGRALSGSEPGSPIDILILHQSMAVPDQEKLMRVIVDQQKDLEALEAKAKELETLKSELAEQKKKEFEVASAKNEAMAKALVESYWSNVIHQIPYTRFSHLPSAYTGKSNHLETVLDYVIITDDEAW